MQPNAKISPANGIFQNVLSHLRGDGCILNAIFWSLPNWEAAAFPFLSLTLCMSRGAKQESLQLSIGLKCDLILG